MEFEDRVRGMLAGKALIEAERVCDVMRFFFCGDGEVALHARCLVRLMGGGRLVASSSDAALPAVDLECDSLGDFQWNRDFSAYDFCVKGFMKKAPRAVVTEVALEPWGDMILTLDGDASIEILTDSLVRDGEQWRLFRHGASRAQEHVVRYPSGFVLE
jgi:hypothetical protein